jgi:catechol 2,3-dioxygenase-like lactoylglutathione lyase family enzyme
MPLEAVPEHAKSPASTARSWMGPSCRSKPMRVRSRSPLATSARSRGAFLLAAGEAHTEERTVPFGHLTFQRLPTHRLDLVEVYAPEHSDIRMIPDEADFVVAFVVDDIREAMAEMQAAGLELVNEPVRAAEAFNAPSFDDFAWFCGHARPTVASTSSSKSRTDDRREPRRLVGRRLSQFGGAPHLKIDNSGPQCVRPRSSRSRGRTRPLAG